MYISFTILSMTLSLAAVFIPLVFLPGLLGRNFREFSITIIVAIFASGLILLTLTPLMCARAISGRGPGSRKTWVEQHVGDFRSWVVRGYGRSLDWFLKHSWLTAAIYTVYIFRVYAFYKALPFSLLPTGDSGFVQGLFLAQEGSSPGRFREQQRAGGSRPPGAMATQSAALRRSDF